MKIKNLVYIIILLKTINCYSQKDLWTEYYDSLSKALTEKPGIHSIKAMNLNYESKPTETSHSKYRKDGSIELTISFKPDSIKYFVIEGNDVSYYYPDHVVFSWYKKTGKKKYALEKQYDYASKKYINDGLSYYYSYSSKSTFIFEEKYAMGKRLSKRSYFIDNNDLKE